MADPQDETPVTPIRPEPSAAPPPLGLTLNPAKLIGAVLNAAYDPCECESCEVLREVGRELAGSLRVAAVAEESKT